MNQAFYPFATEHQPFRFEFLSVGKTVIKKAVIFESLDGENLFNLAMGDVNEEGELDVFSRSNNGDMKTVLSTVVQIVKVFFENQPDSQIYIEGSTPVRIRLYQIAIERELSDFQKHFLIGGFYNDDFELFRRNVNYSALVISLKKD